VSQVPVTSQATVKHWNSSYRMLVVVYEVSARGRRVERRIERQSSSGESVPLYTLLDIQQWHLTTKIPLQRTLSDRTGWCNFKGVEFNDARRLSRRAPRAFVRGR